MSNVAAAFVKAKRAFSPVLKDKTNPAFRSKYADLGACLEAIDSPCLENGLAVYQETSEDATGVTVETVFLHESGEMLRCGKLHVPASKQDPQGYGSALTYARRYSLMAACGIAPEDDDGNAASKPAKAASRPVPPPKRGAHADVLAAEADNMPQVWKDHLNELAERVCVIFDANEEDGPKAGYELIAKENLDDVQKIYLSAILPSGVRNPIKAYSQALHASKKEAAKA
jgi:hypothetical protein